MTFFNSLQIDRKMKMESATDIPNANRSLDIPILALAALLGEEFSIDWILALSSERASMVLAAIDEGIQKGILKQSQTGVYAFRHPEMQAECLSPFSPEEQARLHRRVVDRVREEFPDETDILPVVTHQLMQTTNDLDGCRNLFDAGEKLRKAYHHQRAIQCYEKVINDLRPFEGNEADQLFVRVVISYSRIFRDYDDLQGLLELIKEALSRAKGTGMQPFQALLKMHLAKCELFFGRQAAATRAFNEGLSRAQETENPDVTRYAVTFRMFFHYRQGRYHDVIEVYEAIEPEVKQYPRSQFSISATTFLGLSFAYCGKVAEGLGILYGLYDHCRRIGDTNNLQNAMVSIADVFLEIGDADRAILVLEEMRNIVPEHDDSSEQFRLDYLFSKAFTLKQEHAKALEHAEKAMVIADSLPEWYIQTALFMEKDGLFRLSGMTLEQSMQSAVKSRNAYIRGMGYSLKARLLGKNDRSPKEVLRSLKLAIKWLKASGHELQLAKTRFELARVYLQSGDRIKARKEVLKAHEVLAPIDPALIPEDLSPLLKGHLVKKDLQKEILSLGQEIVAIRDNRTLALRILTGINQLTGTERGAILLLEDRSDPSTIKVKAEKHLTDDQVAHPSFSPAMDIIRETVSSGTGRVVKMLSADKSRLTSSHHHDVVRSCFCVPMVLGDEVIGVLYHDNRFFDSVLEETDLDALSFLAGQAAIALDNARAYGKIQQLNQELMEEKQYYMEEEPKRSQFRDFIGKSPAIQRIFDQINKVAGQDTVVLIQGETGTGKELIARSIQSQSDRNEGPFISADCNALAETIITSELFGHEKGAFTGALARKIGRFELAHGGTLFLDEIANIPLEVQSRLLRVLQTKEFQRVGGLETIHSDFRLITATNKDLSEEVASGRFREDLYYRLNVFPIIAPPLRERRDDIPRLALYFLGMYAAKMGKPFDNMPKAQMDKLLEYSWPGNVRELQNVIERGVILSSRDGFIVPELMGDHGHSSETGSMTLAEVEGRHILRVLEKTGGKISGKNGAAQALGLPYSTLYSRMKKLGIKPARG